MKKVKQCMLLLLPFFVISCTQPDKPTSEEASQEGMPQQQWNWPDSLDALAAAPQNHELVYENEEFRILRVTVVPGVTDPIHTHQGKSLIWVTKNSPLLYNTYDYDADKKLQLVQSDTIITKPEELFKGVWENPEPPHSVINLGTDPYELYRIEYK